MPDVDAGTPPDPNELQAKCPGCNAFHPLDYFIKWGNRERQVRSVRCKPCFVGGLKGGNVRLRQTFDAGLTRDEVNGVTPFNPAIIPTGP